MNEQQPYTCVHNRNGTEFELAILSPEGEEMALIWYWDCDPKGSAKAEANAQLILDALNAYGEPSSPSGPTASRSTV